MSLSVVSISPTLESETIHPSIDIIISIPYLQDTTIPISIQGIAKGADKRELGRIFEVPIKSTYSLPLKARHFSERTNSQTNQLSKTFRLVLDKTGLSHIEKLREKDKKGDVIIHLDINISYLEGRLEVGGYNVHTTKVQTPQGMKDINFITLDSLTPSYGHTHLQIPIPSQGDRSYLNFREESVSLVRIIPSSDWVNDFLPKLGMGEFLVMEIPELMSIDEPKDEIEERLHSASKHLMEIKKSLRAGEWEEVAEDCRGVYENLRKNFKENFASLIRNVLRDDNGISDKGIDEFMKMIDGHNGFIHEFHHVRDENGKRKNVTVHKEDAYALYITLVGLVNMLTTKYHRLKKLESK